MAPPVQSLEDFFYTTTRWQWPSSQGEDTIFNRFKFNLLYYQINYLLCVIVNLCWAELGFRIELWTGFPQEKVPEILSIRRVYGLIPLMIFICFHVFLRYHSYITYFSTFIAQNSSNLTTYFFGKK